jgi:hypothetical protein
MTSCGEYTALVCSHTQFRYLFLSYIVNNLGNWLTYIACIDLIDVYAPASHKVRARDWRRRRRRASEAAQHPA